jgi:hypothetical protein
VRVLQGLHDSEIRCGIQNEPPAGGITAWIDYGSRTEKATFYGSIVGDRQVWPAADRIAAWMHETALRLFPDSPYAKSTTPKRRRTPPKISALEKAALRIMRNLEAVAAFAVYQLRLPCSIYPRQRDPHIAPTEPSRN